jgi:hypothetical protein
MLTAPLALSVTLYSACQSTDGLRHGPAARYSIRAGGQRANGPRTSGTVACCQARVSIQRSDINTEVGHHAA